jgi:hypothetical protein
MNLILWQSLTESLAALLLLAYLEGKKRSKVGSVGDGKRKWRRLGVCLLLLF